MCFVSSAPFLFIWSISAAAVVTHREELLEADANSIHKST